LLCGLQGAGKTTAAAKLARYLKEEEKRRPVLVAADTYRPAAAEQLQVLGDSIGVRVYREEQEELPSGAKKPLDAVGVVRRALASLEPAEDCVLVDTAGRQAIDEALMSELKKIADLTKPDETLLVLDAMTGQEAANVCAKFDATTKLSGAVLTKLDGDSRGGAALSVREVSGVPIKFVGVGEKVADLEPFYPARMASRILGMGDVVSLVEKASKQVSAEKAEAQLAKVKKGEFDFVDYQEQANAVKQMGNFGAISKMLPGMGGIDPQRIAEAELKAKVHTSLIQSMTKKERRNPDLLLRDKTALSRLKRIAKGAGRDIETAQRFIGEFQTMRTMMARMAKNPGGAANPAALAAGGAPGAPDPGMMPGNRAARRAAKKKGKNKAGAARGFGG